MEEGVGVGKLHDRANGNDLQVREKCSIFLEQRVRPMGGERHGLSARQRFQPEDGGDGTMLCRLRKLKAYAQLRCRSSGRRSL